MAGLKLENICKRYGAVQVIENLSLDVAQGEFVVFLGPSGCGKTSLLRMIAGLEEVTGGRIAIGDRDVTHAAPGQRNVAMVFQHYALYPHMTVRDNLAFGLKNIGIPADEIAKRITESARMLELDTLLDRKPGQLSGGQRQRVAIGRAVVKEPGIFLFDEPLSNLDAALRGRTRLELAQLHQRLGATMVFVTHDQIEAMTLATRIVVMKGGAIEQVATPAELYRRPATKFVASFIGTPGMGFVPVERTANARGRVAVTVPGGQVVTTHVSTDGVPSQGLVMGVRPENLRVAEEGPLRGRVELVEFLGERTLAHLKLEGETPLIVTVAAGQSPKLGAHVHVTVDLADAHLFDESGRAHHAEALS
ncbi:sn-glycerol-3-phosphate ABC transporter ATP-binding protein UgpC [Roseateles asaccharophilus]|uniref:Multiple sugar transport system ATP-binding protein n=1 Tax=Roseateles asaccharophilus TaxID=582607 RepID=A0ABU2AA40_9BURK|nr:sn-glycerol-3-phosphate ABC transporter ATP-binding protein UgpC [Roseateles asaccharophilus]MDR7333448.1 multiple sugar transport system ATP-binding protein [Roseateles asaccharophilus]